MSNLFDVDDPLAQLDDETPKAFAALHDYVQMGAGRSLRLLAQQYKDQTDPRPPTRQLSQLKEWSTSFHWQQRVAVYDEQLRKAERQKVEQLRLKRAAEIAESDWELGEMLRKKAREMLSFPLAVVERETGKRQTLDGEVTIDMTIVKPAKWGFADAAKVAEAATKLARLATDQPTDRQHLQIDGMTPRDLSNLTRDELLALKQELERRK